MPCKFCFCCASLLDESDLCQNTKCQRRGLIGISGVDNYLKHGPIGSQPWFSKLAETTSYPKPFYVCNTCQYIMYHHLNYCYKCGGEFKPQKMTYKEMKEKYGNYCSGY